MRRWIALVTLAAAAPAAAQTGQQPRLVFAISGGVMAGSDLWTLPKQLVIAPANSRDTLALGRRLRPGLVAALSATMFRGAHLGYTVEIGYFGAGSEGRCAVVGAFTPDAEAKNQQACQRAQGQHHTTSIIGFQGGLTYRFLHTAAISPYVRATAGIGALAGSYVQTEAQISGAAACGGAPCLLRLLEDPDRRSVAWVATLAAGTSARLAPGYQFRFEVRDFVTSLSVASDSGTPTVSQTTPVAKTRMRTRHIFTLTAGLEVVLERRHRRRY